MQVAWQVLEHEGESFVNGVRFNEVVVIQHKDVGASRGIGLRRSGDLVDEDRWVWRAAITYVQNRVGSLSLTSSDSQATGASRCRIHSASSVVLPKPAGAERSVSLWGRLLLNRAIKCGRGTTVGRAGGI